MNKHRILLVDCDAAFLSSIKQALSELDYKTFAADCASKGIELIKKHGPFSVVASGFNMSKNEMNGLEFLRAVMGLSPNTYRILIASRLGQAEMRNWVDQGEIDDFLLKPVDRLQMRNKISSGVAQYVINLSPHFPFKKKLSRL